RPNQPAYRNFTCTVDGNKLVLATGTRGSGARIEISAAPEASIAGELHLLADVQITTPENVMLTEGAETPYGPMDAYAAFIADRTSRQGIYALEDVDLFNMLCLPGVTDAGILADAAAYCEERRAFFIIDSPATAVDPEQMLESVSGNDLPKSEYEAVYSPSVYMADPLRNGKLRLTPPSGTIAGLFARTDGDRGVWKPPAGTEAGLVGVQALQYVLTDGE